MPDRTAVDPYAILGVPRDASPLQVARARRRLAKQFHPDLHPGEDVSSRMRRVNDAWRVLSSPSLRAEYDHAHPASGTPRSGHWAATRSGPAGPAAASASGWATWRASEAETRSAPQTRRAPGEIPSPPTRRPAPISPITRTFRDSGWAAFLAVVAFLAILTAAIIVGRLT